MTASASQPFPQMFDLAGLAVPNGYVYFGTANLDPQAAATQVAIFWDAALTVPAAWPVRTTAGGFYAGPTGAPGVIYTSGDFSMAVHNHNNVRLYSAPSYTTAINSANITFGAVIVGTSILPDAAGGAFNGTVALPWSNTVTQGLQAKTATVYNQAQPTVAADLASLDQLMLDLLGCRQTSTGAVAALVNLKNTASIVRSSAGVYVVTPTIALPASYLVSTSPHALTGGVTTKEIVCTFRGTLTVEISTRINNVPTDMGFDLIIKGNPAVADPIA